MKDTLAILEPQESAEVVGFTPSYAEQVRLVELGLVPGSIVKMIQSAPLGDPIEIEIMDTKLCIRKSDAESIEVKRSP